MHACGNKLTRAFMPFLSAHQATKHFCVSACTLRRWEQDGRIQTRRTPGGQRLYNTDTKSTTNPTSSVSAATASEPKLSFVYARVSSTKQHPDLERQRELLQSKYPSHAVVTDVGSGINFKRRGLNSLLEQSSRGLVEEIVVTHRDRLCRFAFELIETVFRLHGTKIVVLFHDETSDSGVAELADDMLAINTVFICRRQGKRAAQHRREHKKAQKRSDRENRPKGQDSEVGGVKPGTSAQIVPQCITEDVDEKMDGGI